MFIYNYQFVVLKNYLYKSKRFKKNDSVLCLFIITNLLLKKIICIKIRDLKKIILSYVYLFL